MPQVHNKYIMYLLPPPHTARGGRAIGIVDTETRVHLVTNILYLFFYGAWT
jgi:hypothetical protein